MPDPSASREPALSAPLQPAPPAEQAVVAGEDDIRLQRGPRGYRVRGLKHDLSAESLKVTLRVSAGDHLHLDTLDLYQARARYAFAKGAAIALGVGEEVITGDLSALVLALEPLQEAAIRGALKPDEANSNATLSEADEAAGLALLRDPGLVERIIADVEAIGVVGDPARVDPSGMKILILLCGSYRCARSINARAAPAAWEADHRVPAD